MSTLRGFLLFSIWIFGSIKSMGQFPCVYDISTNPEGSFNEQIATRPQLAPFKNEFSWFANDGVFVYSPIPFVNMGPPSSPFSGAFPSPYDLGGAGQYFAYLHDGGVNEKDFLPQDGWELISLNLGYYPNGDILPNGSLASEVPFILLYNKYKKCLEIICNNHTVVGNQCE